MMADLSAIFSLERFKGAAVQAFRVLLNRAWTIGNAVVRLLQDREEVAKS